MTMSNLDKPIIDKSGYSNACFRYRHKICKGNNGKCTCECHEVCLKR